MEKPSIVLILTDDQRWDSLWAMPQVHRLLVNKGVDFSNAFVSNSLCCPSRASILTGQYSHTTGVYDTGGPYGGFKSFQPHEGSTVATWLHDQGYKTALIGKYLNGFRDAGRAGYVPVGWDRFLAFAGSNGAYYDYYYDENGTVGYRGAAPFDYSTDFLARNAVRFIRGTQRPLFLYFAPYAPHAPNIASPAYAGSFDFWHPPKPPSYNEADVSDKPLWVQGLAPFGGARRDRLVARWHRTMDTLLSVDDAVGQIVQALKETGRLRNTMIVFMSDNGLLFGEHRWSSKAVPYEESMRVPLVIRYDPLTDVPRTDAHPVVNIDLAPTFADLGGTTAPQADGRSLLPLLQDPRSAWRSDFLIEHHGISTSRVPTYCGVQNADYEYVVYSTGEEELYDLVADPYQLHNRAANPAYDSIKTALRQRLKQLCDPTPPGFTWPF